MQERIKKVKEDLRRLRHLSHNIDASLEVKRHEEARLAFLCEHGGDAAEMARVEGVIAALKTEEYIRAASELEERYMSEIGKLSEVERTIVLKGYVMGTPFWRVARELGYSERSVKAKAQVAIEQIAKKM